MNRCPWTICFIAAALSVGASAQPAQEARLVPSDGAAGDYFGGAVAVSGDLALIGAPQVQPLMATRDWGAAYVFRRAGGSWNEEQKLEGDETSDVPGDNDSVGTSVAISGNLALIGAPYDDDLGQEAGAVYAFRYDGAAWQQEQKLVASDGNTQERFGATLAMSPDVAVVGTREAQRKVYFFRYDGASWIEEQIVSGPAPPYFGFSVAVQGDLALIGAREGNGASEPGSAYIFRHNGTDWQEEQQLLASDGEAGDFFGAKVGISNGTVIVGAIGDDDQGSASGAAYVFRYDGSVWQQDQKLVASDGAASDGFGRSVAIDGEFVVVGATGDDDAGPGSGSAYLFHYDGAVWQQETKLLAFGTPVSVGFGAAAAISGDAVLVGEPLGYPGTGAAYVFRLGCGDGVHASSEQCDDGNTTDGDCCSSTCQFQGASGAGGTPNCCLAGECQAGVGCGATCFTPGAICKQDGGPGTACTCELP